MRKNETQVFPEESAREVRNKEVARKAAAEGMVLLKNNGVLPLEKGANVSLFGIGAIYTLKGGMGSGDVFERRSVSIYEGMKAAGFQIGNEDWIQDYQRVYQEARELRRKELLALRPGKNEYEWILMCRGKAFAAPKGRKLSKDEQQKLNPVAFYVVSRQAGEGVDRTNSPGDYYFSEQEISELKELRTIFNKLILVLNCGSVIDLSIEDEIQPDAIILCSQPGMEGGTAFAQIVSGDVSPSGKLTDTWARNYEDYPSAKTFCAREDAVECYEEGIYVGYRYFDAFQVEPRYPFGFGLTYSKFKLFAKSLHVEEARENNSERVTLSLEVANVGQKYSGREVVQLYVRCPEGELEKEVRRLCAFKKTPLLKPGDKCDLSLSFDSEVLASYDEKRNAWVLEEGEYKLWLGNSSKDVSFVGALILAKTTILRDTSARFPIRRPLQEIHKPGNLSQKRRLQESPMTCELHSKSLITEDVHTAMTEVRNRAAAFTESLSVSQLIELCCGRPNRAHGISDTIGSSGRLVPGSAGETSCCAEREPWNLQTLVMADGPAGLRLTKTYYKQKDGSIEQPTLAEQMESGLFAMPHEAKAGEEICHQFCTAYPIGTMLAQSWDVDLIYEVGASVGEELLEYGVQLWLAPGMNIHRNPLGGRNFEYYSEDPILSGTIAAALTRGVQSHKGVGVTVKHFCCNNCETNRKRSDSVVSQRALREIYLRGFEIAIKQAKPVAVMSSYNCINGEHAANSFELLTRLLRDEWGFQGVVVSDWTTTGEGGSIPSKCVQAGNDLIMPGAERDMQQLRASLESGELTIEDLRKCVQRIVLTIWNLHAKA